MRHPRPGDSAPCSATSNAAACSRKRWSCSRPSSAARRRSTRTRGRDHYPKAFSCVLWGGGVNGGQAYGKTDKGIEVTENKVGVPDFNATIAYALGLPLDAVIYSPTKRPFTVADHGQPVTSIFG